jgi:hypothetical protein
VRCDDVEQHRLPPAGVARKQQRPSLRGGLIDERVQDAEVLLSPDELRWRTTPHGGSSSPAGYQPRNGTLASLSEIGAGGESFGC